MHAYYVEYKLYSADRVRGIQVPANNQYDAYDKATFELIPAKESEHPYSSWVSSVTYNNGNCHSFNNFEGKPYSI